MLVRLTLAFGVGGTFLGGVVVAGSQAFDTGTGGGRALAGFAQGALAW